MNEWWVEVPEAPRISARRRLAERAQLEELVARPERSGPRRSLVLVAGGLAVASATGAAVAYFGSADVSDRGQVQCHTTVEAARGVDFAGTGVELRKPFQPGGSGGEAEGIREAVGQCAELWESGILQLGAPNAQDPTGRIEAVPPLTACVSEQGIAAVFPTRRDVCTELGLREIRQ